MKKYIAIGLVILLTLALTSAALAAVPAPEGPFNSAFRVQNLGAADAKCTYVFYDGTGASKYTSGEETVVPGDSLYVYVPSVPGLAGGSYSAVVSCDQPVAAVSNFSDPDSGASHSGISDPGTTWYAPGVYDDFYDYYSNIVVQNATSGTVDVTVEIYEAGNSTPVDTKTSTAVPAYASVAFEQEGTAGMDVNKFYSAKIIGTGDVAVIVNIYGKEGNDDQLYSYNAFKSGSTKAYAPIIMHQYYGYDTSLVIQNMGSADAAVTVEYTTGRSDSYTIAPGAAESLYTPALLPAANTLYGATVTSTNGEPIVVLVNQSNGYNRAASYNGFAAGGSEVRAPIVMKDYYGFDSSVTCQNVGAADTVLTITYAGITGSTASPSIGTGETALFYQPADPLLATAPADWISSATITSSGSDFVCVVNQDTIPADAETVQDQLYSYNGIIP
jgi:hypothetical protein